MNAKKLVIAAAGAMAATVVLGNAPAHADVQRADPRGYVLALASQGIDPRPVSDAIDVGYTACAALWQRIPPVDLIDMATARSHLARDLVVWVVVDASVYLCPDAPFDGGSQTGPQQAPPPPSDSSQMVSFVQRGGQGYRGGRK